MSTRILDNRNLLPGGCDYIMIDNDRKCVMVTQIDSVSLVTRCEYRASPFAKGFIAEGCLDVNLPRPDNAIMHNTAQQELHETNAKINALKATPYDFKPESTVVIVGAGTVPEEDLELVKDKCTVTLGAAQTRICGTYYMDMDAIQGHYNQIKDADCSNTIAHIGLQAYPKISELPWKAVTWFAGRGNSDLPKYHDGKNVTFSALQFAAKTLKAKKIIMLGIQHGIIHNKGIFNSTYYEAGLFLQACCWWLAQAGVAVWNCTPDTTVVNGVILAGLKDALI